MGSTHYLGKWEGVGSWKSRVCWAPNVTCLSARCHFTGPKKLASSSAQPPPTCPSNGCCPHQKHYRQGRINRRCIISYHDVQPIDGAYLTCIVLRHLNLFLSLYLWPFLRVIRARICKRLRRPGIDSEDSIPPAYGAWRAGTINRVVVPARQAGNRFLCSFKGLQI